MPGNQLRGPRSSSLRTSLDLTSRLYRARQLPTTQETTSLQPGQMPLETLDGALSLTVKLTATVVAGRDIVMRRVARDRDRLGGPMVTLRRRIAAISALI